MIPRFGANPAVQASPAHRPRAALHPAGQPWGASWATLARPRRGSGGWGGEAACPGGIPGNRPSSRGVRALVAHAPSAIWSPRSSAPPLRPPCAPHRWEAKRRRPVGQGGR